MTQGYLLKEAKVATSQGLFEGDVRLVHGRVAEIGQNLKPCSNEIALDCRGQVMYPGLINSHDHLEFNLFPKLGEPPYRNAYEWGLDLHRRWSDTIRLIERIPLRMRLLWGTWKNLLSGVTFVVHHGEPSIHFRINFPINVLRRYTFAHSLRFEPDLRAALRRRRRDVPFIIHVSEGIDGIAANEISALKKLGGLDHRTVVVHATAITENDVRALKESRAAVVWCPSSNIFLFERTAPVEHLWNTVSLALGTDSTLTGSISLFDELRVARRSTTLSPQELFDLVTDRPAQIFRLPPGTGTISEGAEANFFLLPDGSIDPFERFLNAQPGDLSLLVARGRLLLHDRTVFRGLSEDRGMALELGRRSKWVHDPFFPKLFRELRGFLGHYSYLGPQEPISISFSYPNDLTTRGVSRSAGAEPPFDLDFVCPSCRKKVGNTKSGWVCSEEGLAFGCDLGIPDFILPSRRDTVEGFLAVYQKTRSAEGWGSKNLHDYLALPYSMPFGNHSDIWRVRAKSFEAFMTDLSIRKRKTSLRVLDLGAGNCWMSMRLAEAGHQVIALDINLDADDGLMVSTRLHQNGRPRFSCVRAEFDYLPFGPASFDVIIFNASLHYSINIGATLQRALTSLKDDGILYILDSPIYRESESGRAMIRERREEFQRTFGINVSEEYAGNYLTYDQLDQLRTNYNVSFLSPNYGLRWNLRPLLASLLSRREPTSFKVVVIRKLASKEIERDQSGLERLRARSQITTSSPSLDSIGRSTCGSESHHNIKSSG